MNQFEEYVVALENFAIAALQGNEAVLAGVSLEDLFNGTVGSELRRRVPLIDRQKTGAFFTGSNLRARAIGETSPQIGNNVVWDPACGAGDLLLSYASRLKHEKDIAKTLLNWSTVLHGNDIEEVFIRATKARLVLLAYHKGSRKTEETNVGIKDTFSNISNKDFFKSTPYPNPTDIILNPPYIPMIADDTCEWGRGRISAAAMFVDKCLKLSAKNTRIIAILPDVLRTGSRYARWRQMVLEYAELVRLDVYGSFDPQADVDVFIVEFRANGARIKGEIKDQSWGISRMQSKEILSDRCKVSVGSVVPHRDDEIGTEYPFLHSRDAPPWGTIDSLPTRRCFQGSVFQPPFVVIRRTSSPSDKHRAIGTIVNCDELVAVENHLLVCKPYENTIESCEKILNILKSNSTNVWLNNRIRCRHLTVASIKEIPILQQINL